MSLIPEEYFNKITIGIGIVLLFVIGGSLLFAGSATIVGNYYIVPLYLRDLPYQENHSFVNAQPFVVAHPPICQSCHVNISCNQAGGCVGGAILQNQIIPIGNYTIDYANGVIRQNPT
jgi:hypothetical protein